MSKQAMREEAERLIREAMARKPLVVKEGNTRIEAVLRKMRRAEPCLRRTGSNAGKIHLQAMRAQAETL